MQQSSAAQAGAQREESAASQSPADRKRKRPAQSRQRPAATSATSLDKSSLEKQQTIQGAFSTNRKSLADQSSPKSKRVKDKHSGPATITPRAPASPTTQSGDRYHFPSRYDNVSNKDGVVDLTKSPRARRPSVVNAGNATRRPFNAGAGAKRLVVKNLKPQSSWDGNLYFDQTWQQLDAALDTVFSEAPVDFSMEDMYRGVENLCRQGRARDVYHKLASKLKSHINATVKTSLLSRTRKDNVGVLQDVLAAWASWNSQIVCRTCQI